ncbi:hypothetical protein KP509_17G031600 [Ceratopteris richardii]|nr:hypothetical protein KP509_17G031600 [Ceratopteris richardii]
MPVSIVARLMGLETMPCKASTANVQVLELRTEDQSAKQLLQFGKISEEKAEKDVRVMDTIIHTSNRTTDSFNTRDSFEMGMTDSDSVNTSAFEHPLAKCESNAELKSCETTAHANSNKGKYSEDFILSDFPASEILLEPIFRSSVSHSSDSAVLLSPSNASLSLKSTVQSFEEPVEVLEPNLCSSKDVGSSAVLHALCRDHGEDDRKHDAGLLRSQPSPDSSLMSMDHGLNLMPADYKGKDTSRCSNLFALKAKQFSKSAMQTKHIDYKEQAKDIHTIVKHKKGVNNMESIDKKLSTSDSCKQETNTSKNGECKSLHSTKFRKTSVESVKTSREQDKLVTISETNPERQASPTVLKLPSINDASPLKKSENYRNHLTTQHAGSGKSSQILPNSSHKSPEASSKQRICKNAKNRVTNNLRATNPCTRTFAGPYDSMNLEQKTGERRKTPHSRLFERKASNVPQRSIDSSRLRIHECHKLSYPRDQRYSQKLASEMQRKPPGRIPDAPKTNFFHENETLKSREVQSNGQTRLRARWDTGGEKKRVLTINALNFRESDNAMFEPGSKTPRERNSLVTNGEPAHYIINCNPSKESFQTGKFNGDDNEPDGLIFNPDSLNNTSKKEDGFEGERILLGLLRKLILSTHASPLRSSCAEQDVSYQDMFSKGLEAVCNITSGYKGGFSLPSEYIQNSTSNIESIEQHSKWQGSPSAREEDSSQDSGSVSGSFCAEECEQPSPISILESPFEDSASSSPDGCGALQGTKALDTAADEAFDSMIRDRVQVEDIRRRKNFKGSLHRKACPYCMDSEGMDGGVQSSALSENEDGYVRQILDAAILPIVSTLWEKLAYSGPSIDPLVYGQFEEHLHQHKEVMYINLCKEIKCRSNNCSSTACRACIMSCHEAATQRRRLLFDCIGAALKSSLELAVQSYGCLVPYIHPCPGYFAEAVYMHLIRWMRFSSNTNLNDMVKAEVNEGMGRWFMFHDEVDNLAATVEAMILKGLIDELSKDSFM